MGGLFGKKSKSQQSSASSNKAFDTINTAFSPMFSQATEGANAFSALLGGDTSGFERYKQATGFDAATEAGSRGITGNAAAAGMLRSGGTGKALQAYGNQMQNQYADNYMQKLLGQAGLGLQAGQLLGSVGNTSTSQGTSSSKDKSGLGKAIGSIGSSIAMVSDRRLKTDITQLYKLSNGLNVYQYKYIGEDDLQIGVMADEVAVIQPEALGPEHKGYQTVDYSKIEGW